MTPLVHLRNVLSKLQVRQHEVRLELNARLRKRKPGLDVWEGRMAEVNRAIQSVEVELARAQKSAGMPLPAQIVELVAGGGSSVGDVQQDLSEVGNGCASHCDELSHVDPPAGIHKIEVRRA